MFDHRHYVPALKWKMGEYKALQDLAPSDHEMLTPLAEIVPVPWDYGNSAPKSSLDEHLRDVPDEMAQSRGARPMFVELGLIDGGDRLANGRHPVDFVLAEGAARGLRFVPVTGVDRDAAFQQAVRDAVARDQRGACLRIGMDDFADQNLPAAVEEVLGQLQLEPPSVDLIVDLRAIETSQASVLAAMLPRMFAALPHLLRWRSFTLLASSFPVNLSAFSPGVGSIPRAEWTVWSALVGRTGMPRLPAFGDYTAAHPDVPDLDPRIVTMSANIRYTIDDEWLIFRGRSVRDPRFGGFNQYRGLAAAVIADARYCGSTFSWGDGYINECAGGTVGTGNATKWREVATNHHMVFVIRQLASRFGTSTAPARPPAGR